MLDTHQDVNIVNKHLIGTMPVFVLLPMVF